MSNVERQMNLSNDQLTQRPNNQIDWVELSAGCDAGGGDTLHPFPSLKTEGNEIASRAVIYFEIACLGQSPEIRRRTTITHFSTCGTVLRLGNLVSWSLGNLTSTFDV